MPQFNPYWWISLISWILVVLFIICWYNNTINLPLILRVQLIRKIILF